jgi:metal-sulfur cluster biosynthetic enzyme
MPLQEEQIRETLKQVIDPELFVNIIDLGLIYNVTTAPSPEIEMPATDTDTIPPVDVAAAAVPDATNTVEGTFPAAPDPAVAEALEEAELAQGREDIFIDMTMTSPACPAGPQLIANTKQVLNRLPGVGRVEVRIVMTPPWTPDMMTEDAKDQLGIF